MSPCICVDASIAAKWFLPEEDEDRAVALYADCLRANVEIVVPPHFPVEVTNVIRRRVARGLVTHAVGRQLLVDFEQLAVRTVTPPGLHKEALEIAEAFNRPTVYDAHYVALARMFGCDLWTADQRLLNGLGNSLSYVKWIHRYPY